MQLRRLSVAMCTCNGAPYLRAQLRSLAAQSRVPDEVVVCDDVSSDATCDIIADFATRAPFPVRLHVNARRLGWTKNFEQAVALCDGELIALSDQDDVWYPYKIALHHLCTAVSRGIIDADDAQPVRAGWAA